MESLIYNILALIIVAFAFVIAGIRFFKTIKSTDKSSCESGCGGCSSQCDLKQIIQK